MGTSLWDRDKTGLQILIKKGVLVMKAYSFENWLNNTIETPFLFFCSKYGRDAISIWA